MTQFVDTKITGNVKRNPHLVQRKSLWHLEKNLTFLNSLPLFHTVRNHYIITFSTVFTVKRLNFVGPTVWCLFALLLAIWSKKRDYRDSSPIPSHEQRWCLSSKSHGSNCAQESACYS